MNKKECNNFNINLLNSNFNMKGYIKNLEKFYINFWKKNKFFFKKKYNFIIHDGPPYANGNLHLGHILNKTIKDIIIKFKNKLGFNIIYILGWDCHGLPIEIKIKNNIKNIKTNLNFLLLCKKFVNKNILIQKNTFKSKGIFSDYNNIYKTLNNKNISEELRIFKNFNKKKTIYNNKKPIFWCFKCKNSLSKSETIYKKKINISIDFFFLYLKLNKILNIFNLKKKYILGGCLVWTTNPWTIVSNQNLSINIEKIYIIINSINGIFIFSKINLKIFKKKFKKKFYIINFCIGKKLLNKYFLNPLFNLNIFFNRESKIIPDLNLIKNTGTGIIHISPAYGIEDYKIFKKYNINKKIISIFSKSGYIYENIPIIKKLDIINLNKFIIKFLIDNNKLLNIYDYNHKYMYCLKHNIEIIYKLTLQWFIKINFKNKLKNKIKKIKLYPKKSFNRFSKIIKKRPNWNISRQKLWGVPLSYILNKKNNNLNKNFLKILKIFSNLYEIYGFKIFNFLNLYDILNKKKIFYKKNYDILDVWFDSGTTHWHVLRGSHKYILKFPSDLCVEGIDQYRGWFQSSLITSYILNKKIPFKILITHGFVLNDEKEKLSKSLNNYRNYDKNIKNLEIDILRLLICNIDYRKDIYFNKEILKQSIEIYRKIRNNIRFLSINISDFNKNQIKYNLNFNENLDKIFIIYLNIIYNKIINSYKVFNFNKIVFFLKNLISYDFNSIFIKILKDKLYTYSLKSKKRIKNQIILYYFSKNFLKIIFPIISFTSQEAWNVFFKNKIIIKEEFYIFNFKKYNIFWKIIKYIFNLFNKFNEKLKNKFNFYKNNFILYLYINKKIFFYLKNILKNLKYLLNISNIKINLKNILNLYFFLKIKYKKKCIRCWNKFQKNFLKNNICKRCILIKFKQNI